MPGRYGQRRKDQELVLLKERRYKAAKHLTSLLEDLGIIREKKGELLVYFERHAKLSNFAERSMKFKRDER